MCNNRIIHYDLQTYRLHHQQQQQKHAKVEKKDQGLLGQCRIQMHSLSSMSSVEPASKLLSFTASGYVLVLRADIYASFIKDHFLNYVHNEA